MRLARETQLEFELLEDPRLLNWNAVRCPRCGVVAGECCKTTTLGVPTQTHAERKREAAFQRATGEGRR